MVISLCDKLIMCSFRKDTTGAYSGMSAGNERRAKQLSVIMFEYCSSMLHSGEISPDLVSLGFEVSKVSC